MPVDESDPDCQWVTMEFDEMPCPLSIIDGIARNKFTPPPHEFGRTGLHFALTTPLYNPSLFPALIPNSHGQYIYDDTTTLVDFVTGCTEEVAKYPFRVFGAASALYRKEMVVCGGRTYQAWDIKSECFAYLPHFDWWKPMPPMTSPRYLL